MKSSCIRHPEREPLIILRAWQQEACEGNDCAGFLLSYFEYWHNIKLEAVRKAREENELARAHGEPAFQNESLVQWHTEEEIERGLLGHYSRKTIREALLILEDKGFLVQST